MASKNNLLKNPGLGRIFRRIVGENWKKRLKYKTYNGTVMVAFSPKESFSNILSVKLEIQKIGKKCIIGFGSL